MKLIEIEEVKEQEVERILNKQKVRGVVKYLVQQKGFTAEYNSCEKEEDLKNVKKLVVEFEGRMNAEVRKQEKLDMTEEKDFRRGELPEKYKARILYGWNNGKFENKYLKKLKRNQNR